MSKLGLSPEEDLNLKTIAEYLFFDEYKDYVTYNRFEQCFQPLFNEANIALDTVFKEICGPKKKYINYPRLINAYRRYKSGNTSNDLKVFFAKLLNEILSYKKSINSLVFNNVKNKGLHA